LQNFRFGTAHDPQAGTGGLERRVGRSQVIFGAGKLASAACKSLDGAAFAFVEIADTASRRFVSDCTASLPFFLQLCRDEVVLRDQLLGAVDFEQRVTPLT